MDLEKNLRTRCHVNTNENGEGFVGIKADADDANIYFPIGYQLPENDDDLRGDVENLLWVLSAFMEEDKTAASKSGVSVTVDFPVHACLKIIRDYLRTGRYYVEADPKYRTDTKGNVSWSRTLRQQQPLIQKNGSLVFANMTIRTVKPSACKQITQIHKFCVYVAFEKMGWLYVPFMPEKPEAYLVKIWDGLDNKERENWDVLSKEEKTVFRVCLIDHAVPEEENPGFRRHMRKNPVLMRSCSGHTVKNLSSMPNYRKPMQRNMSTEYK